MPRLLISKSILELEQFFEQHQDSLDQLTTLAKELSHRKTRRAVRLRVNVEKLLSSGDLNRADGPATQRQLWPDATTEAETPRRGRARAQSQTTTARTDQDYLAPPDEFTLIQPLGTRPRPTAYRPTLKEDIRLDISADDRPVKRFRVALAELIREMRQSHAGKQQFTLEDGTRIATESHGNSYQFDFSEEANVFEGAKVEVIIGGNVVAGQLTGLLQGRIIITIQDDFGDRIYSCVLRIDNTALLQALHDRLESIELGEVTDFRADVAEELLKNDGAERPAAPLDHWPWPDLPTDKQRQFVATAFANRITWLWGPPGIGKTVTLSALSRLLYESGKRVLICSNTNRAVDQLLLQLCRKMQAANDPALEDGRVLRLGRIEDDLQREFGDLITPDRIVERRSEDLTRRKAEIEVELERLGREVAYAQGLLSLFAKLDSARAVASTSCDNVNRTKQDVIQCDLAIKKAEQRKGEFGAELKRWQEAGGLRRLFMRDEQSILRDLNSQQSRIQGARASLNAAEMKCRTARTKHEQDATAFQSLDSELVGHDRQHNQRLVDAYDDKQRPLRQELSSIASKLEDIRNSVLREARIIGATVTRTYLRPVEFASFDTVIVDEASMILLPAVFHAAGLATETVVIAGDFQQLPPIIQTKQQSIHAVLGHNVFEEAGISLSSVLQGDVRRLVMLDEQFRMADSICNIVSTAFYDGVLRSHHQFQSPAFAEPPPLMERLILVDASRVWPFTTRNAFNSRLNLMHALAVRNLIRHLGEKDRLYDTEGKCRVGVCTPYAAQAKLIRDVLKAQPLGDAVTASTVHGFQGDERALMILDLVDSVGERNVGIFLQANQLNDSGAKLWNVALSRAQEGLVVIGNLTFLDKKLPSDAILRGLLYDLQRLGRVLDVRDVLALHPILDDLKCYSNQPDLDPECIRTGLFTGRDFSKLCRLDMESAEQSIVIFSAFITPERAAQMGDVLRSKVAEGVKVRCITRPPNRNGSMADELGKTALTALESLGVAIDLRNEIHEKVVLIDNRVAWFGSLNPLSHTARTTELMARVDDPSVASHIASILAVRRRPIEDYEHGAAAEPENPRCELCGGWSVLCNGKYGAYFRCAAGDDWKRNLDQLRRTRK